MASDKVSKSSKKNTSKSTAKPRKRRVLLDEEAEKLIKEEERQEFGRVLQDQYSKVDISKLQGIPECQLDQSLHLHNDDSFEYWMSVMLQYQTFRSYQHYTEDESEQLKQLEYQKEMRFQLMQKKRAIKRERRRLFKLQSTWENNKRKASHMDQDDSSNEGRAAKRIKTSRTSSAAAAVAIDERPEYLLGGYTQQEYDAIMAMPDDDSLDDLGDFIDTLPTPLKMTDLGFFSPTTTGIPQQNFLPPMQDQHHQQQMQHQHHHQQQQSYYQQTAYSI
jgi:hypothetical protein